MFDFAGGFRVAGAALCTLLAAVLLREHTRDSSARASAFFLTAVVGHLLFPIVSRSGGNLALQQLTLLLGMSAPFAFWFLAEVHFDDDFRPRPGHWALLAGTVGIAYFSWLGTVAHGPQGAWFSPATTDLWEVAPRLVSLALVAHALIRVYVGAGSDLVLARLRLRYVLLLGAGTYMLIELLGELVLRGSPSATIADTLHSALVLLIVFGASLMTLRSSPEALRPAKVSLDGPAADPAILDRLKRFMEEGAYRQEGLTIRGLAERVGTQEHKLRQMINAELGFKNFNAFLHHYRIREAQGALADPARAHLGVAQIAYEVGYRSLGTFNRAFKDVTGRTPTEVRNSR
jgi:AraC-like DNA-binding protein